MSSYEQVQTDDENEDIEHEIMFDNVVSDDHHHHVASTKTFSQIDDLDVFFSQMYLYHKSKGYYPMIVGKLASLFRTFFMVCFSTFFIAYLKWETLTVCANQTVCELELGDEWDNFSSYVRPLALPPLPALIVTVFVLVFALYWLFDLLNFVFRQYWWIRYCNHVYEHELNIPEHELRVHQYIITIIIVRLKS